MATKTDTTLFYDNSTDAHFRAWVQFIDDLFRVTGGWLDTGDTGQMTISTAAHPVAVNTKVGYRMHKMNDALKTSTPCFLKLYFGSGSGSANTPAIWFSIGTGSDGTGNLTGFLYKGEINTAGDIGSGANSATQANASYGSADTDRCVFGMFITSANSSAPMVFGIERSINAGARTTDGFILGWSNGGSGAANRSLYLTSSTGTGQVPVEQGMPHVLSGQNPSAFNSTVGIGVLIPIQGVAKSPGLNFSMVRSSDFTLETTLVVSIYSVNHTFQHLRNFQARNPDVTSTTAILCILYE